jgi:NADH:ubiquinone oxidoreductase subunit 5 (subunit L)/multisubunit Na+/H+ antiporter MnhA subunit
MVMIIPMLVLGILAVVSGFWNVGGQFNAFMGEEGHTQSFISGLFGIFAHPLPWIALIIALLGIFTAYAMYSAKWLSPQKVGSTFKPIYTVFFNKYWLDQLYENVITRQVLLRGLFAAFRDSIRCGGRNSAALPEPPCRWKLIAKTENQLKHALAIGFGIVAIWLWCSYLEDRLTRLRESNLGLSKRHHLLAGNRGNTDRSNSRFI